MIKKSTRMTVSLLFVLVLVASLVQGQSSLSRPLDAASEKGDHRGNLHPFEG